MVTKGLRISLVVFAATAAAVSAGLHHDAQVIAENAALKAAPAIAALPAHRQGTACSLLKLYREPAAGSMVVDVAAPASRVIILGLDESAAFYAVAGADGEVSGWAARQDVAVERVPAETTGLAQVFDRAGSGSKLSGVLPPSAGVILLGASPDGSYYAVSTAGSAGRLDGYVAAGSLEVEPVAGHTLTLAKVYRTTRTADREISAVLPPYHRLNITGRSGDGAWAAVSGLEKEKLNGWMRMSDLQADGNVERLPVFSQR